MKILQINNLYDGAGAENVMKTIAKGLSKKNKFYFITHQKKDIKNHFKIKSLPNIIFSFLKSKKNKKIEMQSYRSKRISINLRKFYPLNDLIIQSRLKKIIKKIDPDIIHCHNSISFTMSPYILAKKYKIPIITTLHGYWPICPNANLLKFKNKKICLEKNWNNCNKYCSLKFFSPKNSMKKLKRIFEINSSMIIPVSNYVKKRLIDFKYPQNKLKTIHNGIDVNEFKKTKRLNRNQILHVGRISKLKGSDKVISIAKKIYKKNNKIKFLFIGAKKPLNLEIPRNCIFYPWVSPEKIRDYYSSSLVVLAPSIWPEPHSLVPLEAMACECPPIASEVGGNSESIINKKTGFLVGLDKKMENKIVQIILNLNKNINKRNQIGVEARKHVIKYFNKKKTLKDYEKIYETFHGK
jgi:glycosyltransferase involved in cell wall biosynthesis